MKTEGYYSVVSPGQSRLAIAMRSSSRDELIKASKEQLLAEAAADQLSGLPVVRRSIDIIQEIEFTCARVELNDAGEPVTTYNDPRAILSAQSEPIK